MMTKDKDFKRRVRARMDKTGETYTAARRQLVRRPAEDTSSYASTAGMSDASVQAKTGMTWAEWVRALDALDARSRPHREIAKLVGEKWPGIGGWWAQTVTVGYERIRGLRDAHQQRTTRLYEASKSRTFAVPVAALFGAFDDPERRRRWLGDDEVVERTKIPERSIRFTWPDGTLVAAFFTAKGPDRSTVAIQHKKLASRDAVEAAKAGWHARLDALAEALGGA
ncbi:MAG: hypothetical protein ACFCGT_20025 [Sandaracinaceae bacterium]